MNETQLSHRLSDLEQRVLALEAMHEPAPIPPMPEVPRLHCELMFLIVALFVVPAQTFGFGRAAAWANRLAVRIGVRGLSVAARRGTPAQREHAARVYGGTHV